MTATTIRVRIPGMAPRSVVLQPGERFTLGRAADCDVTGTSPNLSRMALELRLRPNGVIAIQAGQRYGHVLVRRPDGSTAAKLQKGEQFALTGGAGHLEVVGSLGPLASLELAAASPSASNAVLAATGGGEPTDGQFHYAQITGPRAPQWLVVAALAAVLAARARNTPPGVYPRHRERELLKNACENWFSRASTSGWLTNRLEEAIAEFHLVVPAGGDKVPRIAEHLLDSKSMTPETLALLEEELTRRSGKRGRHATQA